MSNVPKTCNAMVLVEYGKPDVLQEVAIPEIKAGDILVRNLLAGICGTDVHQNLGDLSIKAPLPNIQGHETIGAIAKLGEGVTTDVAGTPVAVGDRIMWAHQFCGKCYACKILQQPFMCSSSKGYGFAPPQALRGGFSEYEYVTAGTDFVRVPDGVTDEEAVGVGCAFRTVINGYEKINKHGGINAGDTVVIQGAGPIGLYSTVMAAQSAASKIIVIGAPAERLMLAKEWGATDIINIDEVKDPKDRTQTVMSLTNGIGAQVVVEASGFPPAINEGFDLLAKAGIYLIMGQTSTKTIEFMPNIIMTKQAVVLGSGSADIRHFYKALKFIEAHKHQYSFSKLISKAYKLEDLNDALESMRKGSDIKAVISYKE